MPKRPEKLLRDILAAGEAVQSFCAGRVRQDLSSDLMLRSAVERQLEILGEAVRRLRDLDPALAARISEHRRIIDFRNVLAHGYDVLDEDIVWQVINEKLPILLSEVRAMQPSVNPP
jgi:uncharacterized protein with HEPN domain